MFTEDNTNGEYAAQELDIMNAALAIIMAEYGSRDIGDDEHAQIEKHHSDRILNDFNDGWTVDDLMNDGREYAVDRAEDVVVYRTGDLWLLHGANPGDIPQGALPEVETR